MSVKSMGNFKDWYDELKKYQSFIIYGAGTFSELLIYKLKIMDSLDKIRCIAVTKKDNTCTFKEDIPIFNICEAINMIEDGENCLVIIAATGQAKYEMLNTAKEYTGHILFLQDEFEVDFMSAGVKRNTLHANVHLVEHCNLRCKGCAHFSNIAEEEYSSIESYESDIKRLSELFGDKMQHIALMGGEPLLHPDINRFFDITRKYFPIGTVRVITNGILLTKMSENFWTSCEKNNIDIHISRYPIFLDYKLIEKKAEAKKVNIYYEEGREFFTKYPLDIDGKQDKKENFLICPYANRCNILRNGRMYNCSTAAFVDHFVKKFNVSMPDFRTDGIDIYDAKTSEEILGFLAKPVEMCAYCDVRNQIEQEWSVGKGTIDEWT